jgi:benzoyl-CoA reductase/2-hydroxyglutaryl-CoA dehydratase subunit BcrC/BadD/HgdB
MVYSAKPLKIWDECKILTMNYYRSIFTAKEEGKKLGWMGASVPPELIRVFNIIPVAGEPYAATSNFKADLTMRFMQAAEKAGFARDLCCYTRTFLGSIITQESPFGDLPTPDFITSIKWDCTTHIQWWHNAARLTGKPFFVIESPLCEDGIKEYHLDFFVTQFKRLIGFLEEMTGEKLDEERLIQNIHHAHQATELWDDILEICQAVPSPLNYKSFLTLMVPAILMRGTPTAVEYYQKLRDELAGRVKEGISGIPEEKYRVIWVNLPLWYNLGLLKDLDEAGVAVVASPYTAMWGNIFTKTRHKPPSYDPAMYEYKTPTNTGEALREMAKSWMARTLFSDLKSQKSLLKWMVEAFEVDGIISHENRGCKVVPLGQMDLTRWLQTEYDLPIMIFEANHGDPTNFSEGQISTRLQAFLEVLQEKPQRMPL